MRYQIEMYVQTERGGSVGDLRGEQRRVRVCDTAQCDACMKYMHDRAVATQSANVMPVQRTSVGL